MGMSAAPARVARDPVAGERTVVRPASDEDADLLVAWHADPEVSRFWDDEVPTRDELVRDLARPEVDAYIVEADGRPIGFLQAWFDEDVAGLDMFLEPGSRGGGFGPDAARALAAWLVDHGLVERLIVDPYLWNEPAIRAWERAGFRAVGVREPDADRRDPWVEMEFER
jgi:aminoglycoside 6'-N-acetyltransferase